MKNKKGFALAEILAVAVVISIIFMTIYGNFFPLKAELDNRINYNDIETLYRSFYIKKWIINYNYESWFTNTTYLDKNGIKGNLSSLDQDKFETMLTQFDVDKILLVKSNFSVGNKNIDGLTDYLKYLFGNESVGSGSYILIVKLKSGDYSSIDLKVDLPYNVSTSTCSNDGCTVSYKSGFSSTKLIIPDTYQGKPITTIGDNAFAHCGNGITSDCHSGTKIKDLSLSDNVVTIGNNAFVNNEIEQLILSNNIDSIGSSAFANNGMRKLIINIGINDISSNAFKGNNFYKTKFSTDGNVACAPTILSYSEKEFNWCDILGVTETVDDCTFDNGDLTTTNNEVLYHIISDLNGANIYLTMNDDQCTD